MFVVTQNGSDEQCTELYDVLLQAGALNDSKSNELGYVFPSFEYFTKKSSFAIMF